VKAVSLFFLSPFFCLLGLSARPSFGTVPGIRGDGRTVRLKSFSGKTWTFRDWVFSAKDGFRGVEGGNPIRLAPGKAWIMDGSDEGEDALSVSPSNKNLPARGFLKLRSGAILDGVCLGGTKGSLEFQIHRGNKILVPLTYIQGFRGPVAKPKVTASEEENKEAKHRVLDANFSRALQAPPLESDLCFYTKGKSSNGEPIIRRIPCKLLGGTPINDKVGKGKLGTLLLKVGGKERSLPLTKVYGVVFAEGSGVEPVAPENVPMDRAKLQNGTVLIGRLLSANSDLSKPWVFQTLEGFRLRLDQELIQEIEFGSPQVKFVSRIPGLQIARTPTLDRKWPVLKDHSPAGRSLKLEGEKFRHGFWVVPNLRMEIPLTAKRGILLGKAGLVSRGKGLVKLRVLGDGKPLMKEVELKGGAPAVSLQLNLENIERVVLELQGSFMLDSGAAVILGDLRVLEQ